MTAAPKLTEQARQGAEHQFLQDATDRQNI
jgi:hypothetical protein